MIRAGSIKEVTPESGNWVFIDIGFANKAKSCGLLFGDGVPTEITFNDAVVAIVEYIHSSSKPINLVIEAPLSVTFDNKGNPKGRCVEKQGNKTRYWYVSLGTTVMVAALYLVRAIHDSKPHNDVRLFEGFVSFKDSNEQTNHSNDVLLLRYIVNNYVNETKAIISPDTLLIDDTDKIQSAFSVAGLDLGVPPILMKNG
ncbi:MAG: hypothetical protein JMN25_14880 [gamma proteobacterium endosymbiont of Lamellibrachia anaximandri]|nr:hypothetical protein [gamma proteobacterium endosymbiont of Lamellibrachia anaximandri]